MAEVDDQTDGFGVRSQNNKEIEQDDVFTLIMPENVLKNEKDLAIYKALKACLVTHTVTKQKLNEAKYDDIERALGPEHGPTFWGDDYYDSRYMSNLFRKNDKGVLLWENKYGEPGSDNEGKPGLRVGIIVYHYHNVEGEEGVYIDAINVNKRESYTDITRQQLLSLFIDCLSKVGFDHFYLKSRFHLIPFFEKNGFIAEYTTRPQGEAGGSGSDPPLWTKMNRTPSYRRYRREDHRRDDLDDDDHRRWIRDDPRDDDPRDPRSRSRDRAPDKYGGAPSAGVEEPIMANRGGSARPRMRGDNAGAMTTRNQSKRKRRGRKRGTRKRGTRKRGTRKRGTRKRGTRKRGK
jgi:hypothetical protein